MKKYDPTKSLKQIFHRPNVVPFYNIMLIFVIIFIAMSIYWPIFTHRNIMDIASAKNAHYEPSDSELPAILIDKNGKMLWEWDHKLGMVKIKNRKKIHL